MKKAGIMGMKPLGGAAIIPGQNMNHLDHLLKIVADIASGRYSGDIMALTRREVAEPVRTIAEAIGLMMVKVEAREYQLETLIEQL
jgi:hypothetical protein